ncbi:MAG: hypothetical protein ABR974_00275 [Bacteroidales bacterium]|jgi:hypothetical protein
MNKRFSIGTGIFAVMLLCLLLLQGCGSGGNKTQKKEPEAGPPKDIERVQQDIKQANKIFEALPSPLESAMLIKSAGAPFDKKFLNPVDNTKLYTTTRNQALNLGIYTCDLSFASLYDQTQLIIDYMNAAKKMADGLGILDAIDKNTIDQLEQNINDKETIMNIISETFLNSNSYLADNDQSAVAAIVLVGGWIEGLYLSTQLVNLKEFNGNKLVSTIVDQKLSIDILANLLNSNKGHPTVDELIIQMNQLKLVFDKIKLETGPLRAEIDKTTNTTMLKSTAKIDVSIEVFKELIATVANIRSTFVK